MPTFAAEIADAIRELVPHWRENNLGDPDAVVAHWEFVDPDAPNADEGRPFFRAVAVDGRPGRYVWHPGVEQGTHGGPEILGSDGRGRHVHIVLPGCCDSTYANDVIAALVLLGMLPSPSEVT